MTNDIFKFKYKLTNLFNPNKRINEIHKEITEITIICIIYCLDISFLVIPDVNNK